LAKEHDIQSIYDELRRLKEKVEERDLTIRQLKRENRKALEEKNFEVRQFKRETQKAKEEKDFEAQQRKRETEYSNERIGALTLERNNLQQNLSATKNRLLTTQTLHHNVSKQLKQVEESLAVVRQERQQLWQRCENLQKDYDEYLRQAAVRRKADAAYTTNLLNQIAQLRQQLPTKDRQAGLLVQPAEIDGNSQFTPVVQQPIPISNDAITIERNIDTSPKRAASNLNDRQEPYPSSRNPIYQSQNSRSRPVEAIDENSDADSLPEDLATIGRNNDFII